MLHLQWRRRAHQRSLQELQGQEEGKAILIDALFLFRNIQVKADETLEVHIEKGMKDGHRIVFYGKGDQEVGLEPGNIIIVIDECDDPVFKRKGSNLHMTMQMTLSEALCGCSKAITTLDKRTIVFTLLPGCVCAKTYLLCTRI